MNIHDYLNTHHKVDETFQAVIISVDIVGSSQMLGSVEQRKQTKTSIRDLLDSLIINGEDMALMPWRGDGGLILCDASTGFRTALDYCDRVASIIPMINRSRDIYNYLPSDMIQLRIVCDLGNIRNTGDPGTLSAEAIDNLVHSEREVGVTNHVVVPQSIYKEMDAPYQNRCSLVLRDDTPLGQCYVLDGDYGQVEIKQNTGTSERLRDWIEEMVRQGDFNELMIWSYTNESLYEYIRENYPNLNIKVLMRNWLVEEKDEREHNARKLQSIAPGNQAPFSTRLWEKAHRIRTVGEQLTKNNHLTGAPRADIRFYSDKPLLKGAILRGKSHRVAFVGLYAWEPEREGGGSPYIGENWPAIWITDGGKAENRFLDTLVSRFDELWDNGKTYDQILEDEGNIAHEKSVEQIFPIDGRPYLILYPGQSDEARPLPKVASEDMASAYSIKEILEDSDVKVYVDVVIDNKYPERVANWQGHIISLCHRTWLPGAFEDLDPDTLPFKIVRQPDDRPPQLYVEQFNQQIASPLDQTPRKLSDYCLIVKKTRQNTAAFIFVAGLHAIGTWGGSNFLTQQETLSQLTATVCRDDFAVVLECGFAIPDRTVTPRILLAPRPI